MATTVTKENRYERFYDITGYDIQSFFQEFVDFVNNDYPSIVSYYNGGDMVPSAFLRLVEISKEANTIEPLFALHSNTLDDISMWDILDDFTEVQTKIATIKSSARWLRSATNGRDNTIQMNRALKSGENFEDVSSSMNNPNPQDDWMNITTPQYIEEEDYTFENGSSIFYINLKNSGNVAVDTVVDALVDENILGRDIDVNWVFVDDDLKTVTKDDAIMQALDIILNALKGCIPEFPEYGIANELVGTTVNAIQYPSIFKDLMNMFQRDSRWSSVELLDVYTEEDAVFLKIQAETVTKTDYLANVPINRN